MDLQGGLRPWRQCHVLPSTKMSLAFSTVQILDHSAETPCLFQNATTEISSTLTTHQHTPQ